MSDNSTSPKVIGLHGRIPHGEPDQNIIAVCRKLLEQAERGEIHGIAVAYEKADGSITTVFETNGNHIQMAQAVSAMWFRFQKRLYDSAEEAQ